MSTAEVQTYRSRTARMYLKTCATALAKARSMYPVLTRAKFLACLLHYTLVQDKLARLKVLQRLDSQRHAFEAPTPSEQQPVLTTFPDDASCKKTFACITKLVTQYRSYGRVRQCHVIDAVLQEFLTDGVVLSVAQIKRYV